MKTIPYYTRQFLLVAGIFGISFTVLSQNQLPVKWETGMTLRMSYSGGMRYYSYKLQISDTSSLFIENVEGKVTYYRLQLEQKDLDSLLLFLKKNRFDRIERKLAGPVQDKGTESLSLQWGNRFIGTGESYMEEITEKYADEYYAICGYIIQLREQHKRKVNSLPGEEPPQ